MTSLHSSFYWLKTGHMTLWIFDIVFPFDISAGQAYLVNLWEGQKYKKPLLQGLHTIFCIGSTVGPFILKPFLVDVNIKGNITLWESSDILNGQNISILTISDVPSSEETTTYLYESTHNKSHMDAFITDDLLHKEVSVIRIGFIIIAGLICLCVFMFFLIFVMLKP